MTRNRPRAPNRTSISVFRHPEAVGRFGAAENERDPGEAEEHRQPAGHRHHSEDIGLRHPEGLPAVAAGSCYPVEGQVENHRVHQRHEKQAENVEAEGHRPGQRLDEEGDGDVLATGPPSALVVRNAIFTSSSTPKIAWSKGRSRTFVTTMTRKIAKRAIITFSTRRVSAASNAARRFMTSTFQGCRAREARSGLAHA